MERINLGFVVLHLDSQPARTTAHGKSRPASSNLYRHAGQARRVSVMQKKRSRVMPAFTTSTPDERALIVGFAIIDADNKPVPVSAKEGCRMYTHAGIARKALRTYAPLGCKAVRVFV